jgi:hypothetical protein
VPAGFNFAGFNFPALLGFSPLSLSSLPPFPAFPPAPPRGM